jgi:AraC family transcriptional regulator
MLEPEIKMLTPKTLAGMHVTMSLVANRTGELWQRFMTRRKEITNAVTPDLVSLAEYGWPVDFR